MYTSDPITLRVTALTYASACTSLPLVSITVSPALTPIALAADCDTITPSSPRLTASFVPEVPFASDSAESDTEGAEEDVLDFPLNNDFAPSTQLECTGCNVTILPNSLRSLSGTATS